MDIKGLDYNTQRKPLPLPEYGREIQKMVDYAMTLPTKQERQICAETIVKLMETKVPGLRDNANYKQTLWDHLYLMGGKQLDIDWPYDVSEAEKILNKPKPMKHPSREEHKYMRHYGLLLSKMFEQIKAMEPSEERDELVRLAANQMKKCLLTWGHGSTDDERIASDLADFTDGKIQLDPQNMMLDQAIHNNNEQPRRRRHR